MESQPQNPEFRINPENVHPCDMHMNQPRLIVSNQMEAFISIQRVTFTYKIRSQS